VHLRGKYEFELASLGYAIISSSSRQKVELSPLLYKYRQESPNKTRDGAQKPERVDQDCIFRRRKFRWIRRGGLGGGIDEYSVGCPFGLGKFYLASEYLCAL
jgi:hypothetical protein